MEFFTHVDIQDFPATISLSDRIMVLGSCFADNMGTRLKAAGFDVCVNPFGTLYNPASICKAAARMDSAEPFTEADCVEMGAGAGLICSYSHHTSFARPSAEEFLENANSRLAEASAFWKSSNKLIVTFGTALVWRHDGETVSNCLKRPAAEFTRDMLGTEEVQTYIQCLLSYGKETILTVSPIRHMADGAHVNTISKSTLLLAADRADGGCYFPAYELVMDELRDYRFYAEDMCHPNATAVQFVWERFLDAAAIPSERETIRANEKAARRSAHRSILNK